MSIYVDSIDWSELSIKKLYSSSGLAIFSPHNEASDDRKCAARKLESCQMEPIYWCRYVDVKNPPNMSNVSLKKKKLQITFFAHNFSKMLLSGSNLSDRWNNMLNVAYRRCSLILMTLSIVYFELHQVLFNYFFCPCLQLK